MAVWKCGVPRQLKTPHHWHQAAQVVSIELELGRHVVVVAGGPAVVDAMAVRKMPEDSGELQNLHVGELREAKHLEHLERLIL